MAKMPLRKAVAGIYIGATLAAIGLLVFLFMGILEGLFLMLAGATLFVPAIMYIREYTREAARRTGTTASEM
jgi:hypothetical protein